VARLVLAIVAGLLALAPAASAQEQELIRLTPDRVDFGVASVGDTQRQTITITNVSSQPVIIGGLSVTAETGGFIFDFGSQNCPRELQPGASCSYRVVFEPFRRGAFFGRTAVEHGVPGGAGHVARAPLTGRGDRVVPHGVTRVVDDDRKQCPRASFQRIQSAIHSSAPGDRVEVCAGSYTEYLRIVDRSRLELVARGAVTVHFPRIVTRPVRRYPHALLFINNSHEVDVRGFTFTGPFASGPTCAQQGSRELHSGIAVEGSGGVRIEGNTITKMLAANPAMRGCVDGYGVSLRGGPNIGAATADVFDNRISRSQADGVLIADDAVSARVESSRIDASGRAGVRVEGNVDATLEDNHVFGNGSGIVVDGATRFVTLNDNTVDHNGQNIFLSGVRNARVVDNAALDAVVGAGIVVDVPSRDNLFLNNSARRNASLDCQDESTGAGTAGTANSWQGNTGDRAQPPAICTP
jgi:parallel beta-helix repeat protein